MTPTTVVNYRWAGLSRALVILSLWGTLLGVGLFFVPVTLKMIPWIALLVLGITFLDTGLFITAHDAMHGTLLPRDRWLNDAMGRLCLRLFAWMSYDQLRVGHMAHHGHPGTEGDPDFHDGKRSHFASWYVRFMSTYVTWGQIAGMGVIFLLLWLGLGAEVENILLFWAFPALLCTLQLFFFGTYLPHRPGRGSFVNEHRARSNDYPRWLSFLTCYHFGYHLEHHAYPFVPWWKLGRVRDSLQKAERPAFSTTSKTH